MKKLPALLLIFLLCCRNGSAQEHRSGAIVVDHSLIVVFKEAPSRIFEGHHTPATLSEQDFVAIERLLTAFFDDYNVVKNKEYQQAQVRHPEWKLSKSSYVIGWKTYKKQYCPVINEQGEKELWINCFCSVNDDHWKKYLISVDDGGNCFFNIKINLTQKKVYDLQVNGVA